MSDVTQILSAIKHGDQAAAEQLLPLANKRAATPSRPYSTPAPQLGTGRWTASVYLTFWARVVTLNGATCKPN